MNIDLRKAAKNDFEKDFVKLINNLVFGKPRNISKNHRNIKLVTTENRRNRLVSEQSIVYSF